MRPAPPGQGIAFHRIDLPGMPIIKANVDAVTRSERQTAVGDGAARVGTVEHLLAAAYACGVDDLNVDVHGPEPPVGDGSALGFLEAIERAGISEHESRRTTIRVNAQHSLVEGNAEYLVAPCNMLSIAVTVEWNHPLVGLQSGRYEITRETFADSLAGARTFGFMEEVNELRAKGLARGASESNVIVLTNEGMIGPDLRWPDEFVRHKVVDLVGDLALLGARVEAEIVALRPNHRGNLALVRFIDRTASMDEIV